jgi:CPA1 family monovalent cation:H+ antiporter
MEVVAVILALLFAVLFSDWITRFIRVPVPLVQIALGAVLGAAPLLPSVDLDPEIFFIVFLPPLLFLDGWRIPKRDFLRSSKTIVALAFGLVIVTVLGIGYFIHWLIPTMPLTVAFALAAVLSPTDPIAVSALAASNPIPSRLMHILEGESLLNDASGLVCLRFAVAATLTGVFSLGSAALTFVWLAVGGIAVGVAITAGVFYLEARLLRRGTEDPRTQILFSLLVPFGVYLAAEAIHVSGILAAVAAGIAVNYIENTGQALPQTRIRGVAVWDTVQFTWNGAIFVLLGEQLPDILTRAEDFMNVGGRQGAWWLPVYVAAILGAMIVLRFAWAFVSVRLYLWRSRMKGEAAPELTWHIPAVTALAGAKGAITLAGVLTLPQLLPNGQPFPSRELAVFLATAIILLSLGTATVGLPPLLKRLRLPAESQGEAEENEARKHAGLAAMQAIERAQAELDKSVHHPDICAQAALRAMERYSRQVSALEGSEEAQIESRQLARVEQRLRIAGLKAERQAFYRLYRERKLEDGVLRRLVREVDLLESRYQAQGATAKS